MKKRWISIFLAIVLFVAAVTGFNINSIYAAATTGDCGTNAKYSYDSATKTLTISTKASGTGTMKDYGVTGLNRPAWRSDSAMKSSCTTLIIEEGITYIGDRAFYQMAALKNVSFPSSLKTISDYAFSECPSLGNITLPENLENIRQYAFYDSGITGTIAFPDSLTSIGTARLAPTIETGYSFGKCPNLTTVKYGAGLTSTGKYAFHTSGIANIIWNENLTTVDVWSFFGCALTKVEVPEYITDINIRAFANNFSLVEATVYNKDCAFNGIVGEDPFNGSQQSLTFYGYPRSTTQTYAEEKGYNFVPIGDCLHDSVEEVVTAEATCTTAGEVQTVCTICGEVLDTQTVAALGHDYQTVETADMTDVDGHIYNYQSCTRCSAEQTAYEHNADVEGCYTIEYTIKPTCTRGGTSRKVCNICGKKGLPEIVAATGHNVEEYTLNTPATCTEDGSRTGICTNCKQNVTVTLPATGHTKVLLDTRTEDNGHTYNKYTCSVCNDNWEECIHNEWVEGFFTSETVSQATCTSSGSVEKTCSVCHKVETERIPLTGHNYDDGPVTKEPTCTASGERTFTCANCGNSYTLPISSLGHDYNSEIVLKEPTCETAGTGAKICSRCSSQSSFTIPALGHSISEAEDYTLVKAPGCVTSGTERGTCANCNMVVDVTIPATGHDFDEENAEVTKKPTCTEAGSGIATCKHCEEKTEITIAATDHNYAFSEIRDGSAGVTIAYRCQNCRVETTMPQSVVVTSFMLYINRNTADVATGYLYDINRDGIINARDYAMLKGYAK